MPFASLRVLQHSAGRAQASAWEQTYQRLIN